MTTPGNLGKRAQSFGIAHRRRHSVSRKQGNTTPLVHVQKKSVAEPPNDTSEDTTVTAIETNSVQRTTVPTGTIEPVTSSPTLSSDATDDSSEETPNLDQIADQVYRRLKADLRSYQDRLGSRRIT